MKTGSGPWTAELMSVVTLGSRIGGSDRVASRVQCLHVKAN